ncbi:MAG: hypothetical protein AB7S70_12255 [Hyphomicrobium sp.]|uniref:hypothetical protein n=1 Tax=Hyphomicrobium sp. TaxID=82 RepID=UPI003D0EB829
MKVTHMLLAGTAAVLPLVDTASAADPKEVSKDIIAVQIRKQGFACNKALSAERDTTAGNPDDPVWTLKCDGASYRVHLIPNMAATVEKLADDTSK